LPFQQHGLSRLLLWPYDEAAAIDYGRVFTQLKRMGGPMQQVDIQIAAMAQTQAVLLVSPSGLSVTEAGSLQDTTASSGAVQPALAKDAVDTVDTLFAGWNGV
jgi:hypothetical protein